MGRPCGGSSSSMAPAAASVLLRAALGPGPARSGQQAAVRLGEAVPSGAAAGRGMRGLRAKAALGSSPEHRAKRATRHIRAGCCRFCMREQEHAVLPPRCTCRCTAAAGTVPRWPSRSSRPPMCWTKTWAWRQVGLSALSSSSPFLRLPPFFFLLCTSSTRPAPSVLLPPAAPCSCPANPAGSLPLLRYCCSS